MDQVELPLAEAVGELALGPTWRQHQGLHQRHLHRRQRDRLEALLGALTGSVAAVSVGIVDGTPLLDLDYSEDSTAEVDMNVVMTGEGALVEVQATAEQTPFSRAGLDELLELATSGIDELAAAQDEAIAAARV